MVSSRFVRFARGLANLIGGCAFILWSIGFVATDRWLWSQYLWWIPWLAYAAMLLPPGALRRRRGARVAHAARV